MLGLAACGGSDSSAASAGGPITYADWQMEGAGRGAALKSAVEGFATSPGGGPITAEQIAFPQFQDTLLTQLGGGNGPDVFNLTVDDFYSLQSQGLLADIGDVVQRPSSDFIEPDRYAFVDGKRYGVIHSVQNYALFINKELFAKAGLTPPTTYEEFRVAAATLTTSDTFGFALRHSMSDEAGWWYDLSNWVYGFGGRWSSDDGTPTVNSPAVVDAVTQFADMVKSKDHPYGSDGATNRRMFWENKLAMMIDNAAVPANLLGENPNLQLEVVPVPFPTKSTVIIPIFTVQNVDTKQPEQSGKFLNYFLSQPVQDQLTTATRGNILATSTAPPQDLLAASPWLKTFSDGTKDAVLALPTGFETNAAEFRTTVLREVDQVITNGKPVQQALDDAQAAVGGLKR
ncbi:ABC transporter substrate-binding protein [Pseudonocardia halophobica]|uniref:ABC transporter substrate-binding protein n=1 Tax=Pseudonocardia halophobica TaxID=29401 RepID=UPI003D90767F